MKINNVTQNVLPISQVKDDIFNSVNKNILILEINKRNNKVISKYEGTIVSALSNLFVVKIKINNSTITKTYSYSDVTVGIVKYEII